VGLIGNGAIHFFLQKMDATVGINNNMRANFGHYNREYINAVTPIVAAVTLVCYTPYPVSPEVMS
jgi:hypothetical protein